MRCCEKSNWSQLPETWRLGPAPKAALKAWASVEFAGKASRVPGSVLEFSILPLKLPSNVLPTCFWPELPQSSPRILWHGSRRELRRLLRNFGLALQSGWQWPGRTWQDLAPRVHTVLLGLGEILSGALTFASRQTMETALRGFTKLQSITGHKASRDFESLDARQSPPDATSGAETHAGTRVPSLRRSRSELATLATHKLANILRHEGFRLGS